MCIILAQKTNLIQLFERDYVNNVLITSPTEITELSNMSVWWICQKIQNIVIKFNLKKEWHTENEIKRHVRFAKVTEESKNILYSLKKI